MAKKKKTEETEELQNEAKGTEAAEVEKKWYSGKKSKSKVMVEEEKVLVEEPVVLEERKSKMIEEPEQKHKGISVLARTNPTQHWKYRDVVNQRPAGARKYFRSK